MVPRVTGSRARASEIRRQARLDAVGARKRARIMAGVRLAIIGPFVILAAVLIWWCGYFAGSL